jgi:hypothetical protein
MRLSDAADAAAAAALGLSLGLSVYGAGSTAGGGCGGSLTSPSIAHAGLFVQAPLALMPLLPFGPSPLSTPVASLGTATQPMDSAAHVPSVSVTAGGTNASVLLTATTYVSATPPRVGVVAPILSPPQPALPDPMQSSSSSVLDPTARATVSASSSVAMADPHMADWDEGSSAAARLGASASDYSRSSHQPRRQQQPMPGPRQRLSAGAGSFLEDASGSASASLPPTAAGSAASGSHSAHLQPPPGIPPASLVAPFSRSNAQGDAPTGADSTVHASSWPQDSSGPVYADLLQLCGMEGREPHEVLRSVLEGRADEPVLDSFKRSAIHLNGVPCFVLQVYRCCGANLKPIHVSWSEAVNDVQVAAFERSTNAAAGTHRELFDDLLASAMNAIFLQLYPSFLESACFKLYVQMLYFSFTRPHMGRGGFNWIKVRLRETNL